MSACSPEDRHDEGAGEQSDEGEAVTQRGQNPHHPVEEQLHTNTSCLLMEEHTNTCTSMSTHTWLRH